MRYIIVLIALSLIIIGCSNPKDIVFGPEPLKQMAEQVKQFKKLPEKDRILLAAYLSIVELGKNFGAEIKPVTGRTVGEVLVDARAWQDKVKKAEVESKKRDAEAEALKAKVLAERKVVENKISSSVVVAVIGKTILPKNYDVGRYSKMLVAYTDKIMLIKQSDN